MLSLILFVIAHQITLLLICCHIIDDSISQDDCRLLYQVILNDPQLFIVSFLHLNSLVYNFQVFIFIFFHCFGVWVWFTVRTTTIMDAFIYHLGGFFTVLVNVLWPIIHIGLTHGVFPWEIYLQLFLSLFVLLFQIDQMWKIPTFFIPWFFFWFLWFLWFLPDSYIFLFLRIFSFYFCYF